MARKITVEVDTREKTPLLFPETLVWCPEPYRRELVAISVVKRELEAGDYRIAEYPDACLVERKKNMDELAGNLLTSDRGRFRAAWSRFLSSCLYPVLLVEQGFPSIGGSLNGTYKKITPPDVLSALFTLIPEARKLTVLWVNETRGVSTRRSCGANLVRLMLSFAQYAKDHEMELPNVGQRSRTEINLEGPAPGGPRSPYPEHCPGQAPYVPEEISL